MALMGLGKSSEMLWNPLSLQLTVKPKSLMCKLQEQPVGHMMGIGGLVWYAAIGGWLGAGYRPRGVGGGLGALGCFVGLGCLTEVLYSTEEAVKWKEDNMEEGLVGQAFSLLEDN